MRHRCCGSKALFGVSTRGFCRCDSNQFLPLIALSEKSLLAMFVFCSSIAFPFKGARHAAWACLFRIA
jgi:hypothetical protein